jgi:S1/P1 Nuclease
MTRSRRLIARLAIAMVSMNLPAYGWNGLGHMTVAFAAYQQLTTKTKNRVSVLLRKNPDYGKWLTQVPARTQAKFKRMMVFMIAATWPDQIKREAGYTEDGTDKGNRPDGPPSSQNTGYSDHLRHRYWHFVDTPFTQDGTALPAIPVPNAEERIGIFRGVLASTDPDPLKSYDLTWLLHLVGDVHQPLHSATRVSGAQPDGDAGGNLVNICNPGCNSELHAFEAKLRGHGGEEPARSRSGKGRQVRRCGLGDGKLRRCEERRLRFADWSRGWTLHDHRGLCGRGSNPGEATGRFSWRPPCQPAEHGVEIGRNYFKRYSFTNMTVA